MNDKKLTLFDILGALAILVTLIVALVVLIGPHLPKGW